MSKGVPSRISAPTPALDQTYDIQIIPGKVRPLSRHLTKAHPQVLIIAPQETFDTKNIDELAAVVNNAMDAIEQELIM